MYGVPGPTPVRFDFGAGEALLVGLDHAEELLHSTTRSHESAAEHAASVWEGIAAIDFHQRRVEVTETTRWVLFRLGDCRAQLEQAVIDARAEIDRREDAYRAEVAAAEAAAAEGGAAVGAVFQPAIPSVQLAPQPAAMITIGAAAHQPVLAAGPPPPREPGDVVVVDTSALRHHGGVAREVAARLERLSDEVRLALTNFLEHTVDFAPHFPDLGGAIQDLAFLINRTGAETLRFAEEIEAIDVLELPPSDVAPMPVLLPPMRPPALWPVRPPSRPLPDDTAGSQPVRPVVGPPPRPWPPQRPPTRPWPPQRPWPPPWIVGPNPQPVWPVQPNPVWPVEPIVDQPATGIIVGDDPDGPLLEGEHEVPVIWPAPGDTADTPPGAVPPVAEFPVGPPSRPHTWPPGGGPIEWAPWPPEGSVDLPAPTVPPVAPDGDMGVWPSGGHDDVIGADLGAGEPAGAPAEAGAAPPAVTGGGGFSGGGGFTPPSAFDDSTFATSTAAEDPAAGRADSGVVGALEHVDGAEDAEQGETDTSADSDGDQPWWRRIPWLSDLLERWFPGDDASAPSSTSDPTSVPATAPAPYGGIDIPPSSDGGVDQSETWTTSTPWVPVLPDAVPHATTAEGAQGDEGRWLLG